MLRSRFSPALLAVLLVAACAAPAAAQDDDLSYNLLQADIKVDAPFKGQLEVLFDKTFPKTYAEAPNDPGGARHSVPVPAGDDWMVRSITIRDTGNEKAGDAVWLRPVSVIRGYRNDPNAPTANNGLVILDMGDLDAAVPVPGRSGVTLRQLLDPTTHRLEVTFNQINFPFVTVGQPAKKGAKKIFTAAKGKPDADIYLSGSATGAKGSKPAYALEAKLRYLQRIGRAGALGGEATFVSDEDSNIDPDSITAAASYEKVFVFGLGTGIILNSNFIGGEFSRKDDTRNLTTNLEGTLVLPSARFSETFFGTMEFLGGFEGGKNLKARTDPDGTGGIWRWKVGANAYLLALKPPVFDRITFSTEYKLRLPRRAETFTETVDGSEVTFFTKKPRHYVGSDLDLLFSPAYGLSFKYRYGSLPPNFNLVDHKASVGFTLKLKQTNK